MKTVQMFLVAVLMVAFGGCKGEDAVGPSGNAGQTKISYNSSTGVVTVTNAYLDGELYNLVKSDGEVSSISDSVFVKFACTGDSEGWRLKSTNPAVDYCGGADVQAAKFGVGDNINCYFQEGNGEKYWLDLGKAECVGGCEIVFEKEHDRHTILLTR